MKTAMALMLAVVLVVSGAWAKSHEITLIRPAVVAGEELGPGDYQLKLDGSKMTLTKGKQSVTCDVTVETSPEKIRKTSVRMELVGGKYRVDEIRLGGTATKLVIPESAGAAGGR
jgi:hypothetical protein